LAASALVGWYAVTIRRHAAAASGSRNVGVPEPVASAGPVATIVGIRAGLAGYEDVNDAERLCRDPAMRWVVGAQAITRSAASASPMRGVEL
jgi:hypothetical protein